MRREWLAATGGESVAVGCGILRDAQRLEDRSTASSGEWGGAMVADGVRSTAAAYGRRVDWRRADWRGANRRRAHPRRGRERTREGVGTWVATNDGMSDVYG